MEKGKYSMGVRKHDVELSEMEYYALLNNLMISSIFEEHLRSPKKSSEYIIISMSESTIDSLAGFVAAEANHAKTDAEEELLSNAYESLEATLYRIKRRSR